MIRFSGLHWIEGAAPVSKMLFIVSKVLREPLVATLGEIADLFNVLFDLFQKIN